MEKILTKKDIIQFINDNNLKDDDNVILRKKDDYQYQEYSVLEIKNKEFENIVQILESENNDPDCESSPWPDEWE